MRIGLIDIDSKMPNLALMKLSAYHKSLRDDVFLNNGSIKYDRIYVSCVYDKNKDQVKGIEFLSDCEVIVGGSGVDLKSELPEYIERLRPDYDLYPDMDYSLGFTSRGCNRKCHFCIVPEKEGKFIRWQHPREFHNERFNRIVFLDNNILFDKEWFYEVMEFVKDNNLRFDWNQGLDIRLIDSNIIRTLHENAPIGTINFAWDNIELESLVMEKIKLIKKYYTASQTHQTIQFYVFIDSDKEFYSGIYRCRKLKELNINAFVMFNTKSKRTKRIKRLQRWANRKWLFWSMDYDEYR